MNLRWAVILLVLICPVSPDDCRGSEREPFSGVRGEPLDLEDLAAYRLALEPPDDPGSIAETPVAVRFRDLWDEPESYRGRMVTLEGRLVRRFRQNDLGTFPPLSELWLQTEEGNLFCAVYPSSEEGSSETPTDIELGDQIQVEGVYIKRLRYAAEDVPRVAPLIVGSQAPTVVRSTSEDQRDWDRRDRLIRRLFEVVIAMILIALVAVSWLLRTPERPRNRHREPDTESRPEFLPHDAS